jgi:hypothetical protein
MNPHEDPWKGDYVDVDVDHGHVQVHVSNSSLSGDLRGDPSS